MDSVELMIITEGLVPFSLDKMLMLG